jgi:hypothetical protein
VKLRRADLSILKVIGFVATLCIAAVSRRLYNQTRVESQTCDLQESFESGDTDQV